jgi:hypothetical protein
MVAWRHVRLGFLLVAMNASMAIEKITACEPLSAYGTGELPLFFV